MAWRVCHVRCELAHDGAVPLLLVFDPRPVFDGGPLWGWFHGFQRLGHEPVWFHAHDQPPLEVVEFFFNWFSESNKRLLVKSRLNWAIFSFRLLNESDRRHFYHMVKLAVMKWFNNTVFFAIKNLQIWVEEKKKINKKINKKSSCEEPFLSWNWHKLADLWKLKFSIHLTQGGICISFFRYAFEIMSASGVPILCRISAL